MKSKKLLSLLLALAMVMSMAACGAKTNEPPATSGTPSETGAPATEELNWPTKEITLMSYNLEMGITAIVDAKVEKTGEIIIPAKVFSDIIRSGVVPTVRLTEIFRQKADSRIVRNAHMISR